jgi:hypothetical protein
MSAKFFDGKTGKYTRMMNTKQDLVGQGGASVFNFNIETYFYYRVELDYNDFTYKVVDNNGQRVGLINRPINWYEYINPPE